MSRLLEERWWDKDIDERRPNIDEYSRTYGQSSSIAQADGGE